MLTNRQIQEIKKYCCENITTIQNYEEAANDTQKWECHHLNEITQDGLFSIKELISKDLYYHRPASELILLPRKEHRLWHKRAGSYKCSEETKQKMSDAKKGENHPMYGVHRFGEKNPMYGKHHTKQTKQKMSDARKAYLKKKIDELAQ